MFYAENYILKLQDLKFCHLFTQQRLLLVCISPVTTTGTFLIETSMKHLQNIDSDLTRDGLLTSK